MFDFGRVTVPYYYNILPNLSEWKCGPTEEELRKILDSQAKLTHDETIDHIVNWLRKSTSAFHQEPIQADILINIIADAIEKSKYSSSTDSEQDDAKG